jgi:hypothetical protein
LTEPAEESPEEASTRDVCAYVRDVAEQLAGMAREMGLEALASALEEARAAADALQENAAPDDAA